MRDYPYKTNIYQYANTRWIRKNGIIINLGEVTCANQVGDELIIYFKNGTSVSVDDLTVNEIWSIIDIGGR